MMSRNMRPAAPLSALAITLLIASTALAQERRAPTIDDLLNLAQVSGAEISPDGTQVIYAKSDIKKWSDNRRTATIRIANSDGTDDRQLLGSDKDRSPQWSPDGKHVAFLSTRDQGENARDAAGATAAFSAGGRLPRRSASRASLGAMVSDWSSEYAMGFNHDISRWYIGGRPWDNAEAYRRQSAYTYIAKVTTATILLHGEQDDTDTIGNCNLQPTTSNLQPGITAPSDTDSPGRTTGAPPRGLGAGRRGGRGRRRARGAAARAHRRW
jgi:hypothetical protein